MCVLMCNFVSYFVCVILCIFVFLCDILLPSGVINDDNIRDVKSQTKKWLHSDALRFASGDNVYSYLILIQTAGCKETIDHYQPYLQ